MRTRRFRVIGIALLVVASLSLSSSLLAIEPVAEETPQGELSGSWSPVQFFLNIWKSVVGGGDTAPAATDDNGLTQSPQSADPDFGPSIEPNGRSL